MNRTYLLLVIAVLLGIGIVSYAAYEYTRPLPMAEVATTTIEAVIPAAEHAYGMVTLSVGETARFPDLTLTPTEVLEDSRCPMNARCIHAGTVRVAVEMVSGMGTSTGVVSLKDEVTTEAESIRLVGVSPETLAGETMARGSYRLTFEVVKRETATIDPAPLGKCYVGGCSSQLCTDTPDAVSTCEYREAYACYQGATCERQASGNCGWTETAELRSCLQKAQ